MLEERIVHLINRFYTNAISESERNEFLEMLKEPANEGVVKRELERLLKKGDAELSMDDQAAQAVLEAIFGADSGQGSQKKDEVRVISMWRKGKWVIAAAVLLFIVGSLWLFNKENSDVKLETAIVPKSQDITPGREGAILTLSDGRKILLDSAGNGTLGVEGNSNIVKKGGVVAYEQEKVGNPLSDVAYNTMSTPRGRQYALVLEDGTKVWLNAASSIRYPTVFSGDKRVVEVTGEAYFEVAHDVKRPFHVSVGEMDVQVLGTHFNINAYEDEGSSSTTLLQGSVRVSIARKAVIIKPGEQAQLSHVNPTGLVVSRDVNIDQVMAWKNGMFSFGKVSLEEVMRQISRWYDVDIEYKGSIKSKKFGGEIQRDLNLSEVLDGLKETGIHFRIEGKKVIVTP